MGDDSLYTMTEREILHGYLFGHTGALPAQSNETATPREALEHVVRPALERPPCGVAFSGGRDSSVVLAVATDVARRAGLPDPLPITKVFPDLPAAEEGRWQEMVLRHLDLRDWHRVVIDDELDLVGPRAASHLVEHGVVWPPTIQSDAPVVESVSGGSLLDGEGGDEVLSVGAHRIAPLTSLVRSPRPLTWRRLRSGLVPMAPVRMRLGRVRRRVRERSITWLRPAALEDLMAELGRIEASAPLSFARSVRAIPRRRTQVMLARNRRILAATHEVDVSSPLLDPDFVHAIARDGGFLGRGDRTATLDTLVPDLLPRELLSRASKAVFGGAYWGRHTRDFAMSWTGGGVDTELVDPDELRRLWCSDRYNALTAALLQQAWLATRTIQGHR